MMNESDQTLDEYTLICGDRMANPYPIYYRPRCKDHALHCNQARMADSGHACNRSQFDGRNGGDYSAISGEFMDCTDAHALRREQTVIEAWLALPAWQRLRMTPSLNKPAA